MKEKLARFMYGRYGVDSFSQCLMWIAIIGFLLSNFRWGRGFYFIGFAAMVYATVRIFSKNTYKRAAENQKFLQRTSKIRSFFQQKKWAMMQKKSYHIYKCPSCKQKIRIPRGKGKIEISCPKCRTKFIKRS